MNRRTARGSDPAPEFARLRRSTDNGRSRLLMKRLRRIEVPDPELAARIL
jgi:hypothetical protein